MLWNLRILTILLSLVLHNLVSLNGILLICHPLLLFLFDILFIFSLIYRFLFGRAIIAYGV
jgi:hypothetical protein